MKEIFTTGFEETRKVGQEFAKGLKAGVVALYGELGSGKTTFAQGMAQGLGIKQRIISPTFTIMRTYKIPRKLNFYSSSLSTLLEVNLSREVFGMNSSRQARTIYFYHIDLYRIEGQKDIESLGMKEILNDPQNIVAIEWAEKLGDLLPKNRIDVWFEYAGEEKRKITITE